MTTHLSRIHIDTHTRRVCNSLNSLLHALPKWKSGGVARGGGHGEVSYYHGTLSLSKFMIRAYNRLTSSVHRFITFKSVITARLFLSRIPLYPSIECLATKPRRALLQRDYAFRVMHQLKSIKEESCVREISFLPQVLFPEDTSCVPSISLRIYTSFAIIKYK